MQIATLLLNSPTILFYSSWSILLPLGIGLLSLNEIGKRLWPLLIVLIIGFILELNMEIFYGTSNIIYHNFYTILESLFLGILLFRLTYHKLIKQGIIIIVLIFVILSLLNLFFFQNVSIWNTFSLMGECVIISIGSVAFLYDKLKRENTSFIIDTDLLIVFSLLFYFAGSFMLFALGQYYVNGVEIFSFNLWIIHSVINILFNLFLSFALIYDRVIRH